MMSDINDTTRYMVLNGLGVALILSSYFIFLPMTPQERLWGDISKGMQTVFWTSILIAAICFVTAFVMILRQGMSGILSLTPLFWVGLWMFFIGSSLWAPMVWVDNKLLVFLALLMTTCGVLIMALESGERMVKILLLVVFLHALVMDNLIWYTAYIQQ